ncbi:MAG: hypothetical protein BGO95_09005 [Micrococcales bacterium 73-13]|nr:MAG: hypothetical protein BGO95_09005 [Micrococcales bacterium 73-13]
MTDPNAQPPQQPYQPPQQPYPPAQPYQQQPAAYAPGDFPGKTLGIVGLILAFLWWLSVVGLILSIIAFNQSKNAGFKNTPAKVGIIVGSIVIGLSVIVTIIVIVIGIAAASIGGGVLQGLCSTPGVSC